MSSLQSLQDNVRNPIIFLFPLVIMWSPVKQFKDTLSIKLECPKCDDDNQVLAAVRWQCGANSDISEPGKIYQTDGVTNCARWTCL